MFGTESSATAEGPGRPLASRVGRRAAVLVLLGAVVVGLAHLPPARAAVRDAAVGWLASRHGIDARFGRLDYNLLALRASARDVSLGDRRHPGAPFFRAAQVDVDVTWSSLWDTVTIQSIAIEQARLDVRADAAGRINLPDAWLRRGAPSQGRRVEIRHLAVRDLALGADDQSRRVSVAVSGIRVDVRAAADGALAGWLHAERSGQLQVDGWRTTLVRVDAAFRFDGSRLRVDPLTVAVDEGETSVRASVGPFGTDVPVDGVVGARVDLGRVSSATAAPLPFAGMAVVSGRISGTLASPRAALHVAVDRLKPRTLPAGALSVDLVATRSGVDVTALRVDAPWGRIDGSGRVVGGAASNGAPSDARAQWQSLDAGALLRAGGVDVPAGLALVVSGHGQMSGRVGFARSLAARATIRLAEVMAAGRVPVTGTVVLDVAEGRWSLAPDLRLGSSMAVSGRTGGLLDAAALGRSGVGGALQVTVDGLGSALDDLRMASGSPAAALPLAGTLDASVSLGGRLDAPVAEVIFRASDVAYGAVSAISGSGTARITQAGAVLQQVRIDLPGQGRLDAEGVRLGRGGLMGGRVTAHVPDVVPLLAGAAPWLRAARAALWADGEVRGTFSDPVFSGTLRGEAIGAAGQRLDRLDARVTVGRTRLEVHDLQARQGDGVAELSGLVDVRARRYQVQAIGRGITVRPCVAPAACPAALPLSAVADLTVDADGTFDAAGGNASITARDVTWDGYTAGQVRARASVVGGVAVVDAELPGFNSRADGTVQLSAPWRFDVRASADRLPLASALRAANQGELAARIAGEVSPVVRVSSPDGTLASADILIDLPATDMTLDGTPVSLAAPARLALGPDRVSADRLSVAFGGATLDVSGGLDAAKPGISLHAALNGDLGDAVRAARAFGLEHSVAASGRVAAVVTVTGTPRAPIVEGTVSLADGVVETPEVRAYDMSGRLLMGDGWLTLDKAEGRWQGVSARVSGRAPAAWVAVIAPALSGPWLGTRTRDGATLSGSVTASPTRLLALLARGQVLGRGQVASSFELMASEPRLDAVSGAFTIDDAELVVRNTRLYQAAPGRVLVRGRSVSLSEWRILGPATDVRVEGETTLAGRGSPLRLHVRGPLDLKPLQPLAGAGLGGVVTADVRVEGTIAEPRLAGSLAVQDGAFSLRNPRLAVSDLVGRARLEGDHLAIDTVTGTINGSTIQASGDWGLFGSHADTHVLRISAERLPLQIGEGGPRGELDVDLQYTSGPDGQRLGGTVGVTPEPFKGSISLIRQIQALQQVTMAAARDDGREARKPIALDVALVSRENLVVDSSFGRVEMAADLRVIGTSVTPLLAGRVTLLEDGEIRAGGKTYHIRRGEIEFTSRRRIEPRLNILAQTQVGDYRVAMLLTGTPDRLQTSLTSDPPLSEADLRSLLVTGRLASDQANGGDSVGEEQVAQTISGDLFGIAASAIGLDSVSVGIPDLDLIAGDIDAEASLNIRKTLTRRFEVFFSQALQEDRFSWMFVYRPRHDIQLRFLSRDNSEGAIEFRQEFAFARPPARPGAAAAVPRAAQARAPRITTVVISGSPGVPESELRDELKLGAGDRFDLWAWREETTRLQAFYRSRGLLAARVYPRRTRTPDGTGVALEYEVSGGPRTVLRVDGYEFSDEALGALRLAWSETVSQAFLVEDLVRAARRQLVDDGYLQSQVTGDLQRDDGRLDLTLSITPGPRTSGRSVDFSGNRAISSGTLMDAIEDARLSRRMWRQGELLVALIARLYQGLGYLDVVVRVGSPEFTGDVARLPVAVTEGRRYTVAGVEVTGASALPAADVQKASGIPAGSPYLAGTVEAVRRAIQGHYLDRAFDEVDVQASARIDRQAGTATVTAAVAEGRRLVLQEISIDGPYHTNSKVVSDALKLLRGTPLGPLEISAAQKRVYDTGAFARVDVVPQPLALAPAANGELPVRAEVTVEEAARYLFRYGVQLSREPDITGTEDLYSVGAGFDFRDRSFFGRAISAGGGVRYDTSNQSARGVLSTPATFGTSIRTNLYVTGKRELDNTTTLRGEEEQFNVTLEQRYRVRPRIETSWGLAYDYRTVSIALIEPRQPGDQLVFSGYTAGPRTGIVWDTRDQPFNARRGFFHSSNLDLGLRALGSELDYTRYLLQQYVYVPAGPVVFASALRWGTLSTFGRENLLSLDLRFKAGGGRTVRGYEEDSLSAEELLGIPLGGKELLVLNQEVRFPVYKWLKGAGFIDGGGTFGSLRQINGDGFRFGAGFGLRLDTPFALVRVDLGYPVNPRPDDKPRWHFAIGQAF